MFHFSKFIEGFVEQGGFSIDPGSLTDWCKFQVADGQRNQVCRYGQVHLEMVFTTGIHGRWIGGAHHCHHPLRNPYDCLVGESDPRTILDRYPCSRQDWLPLGEEEGVFLVGGLNRVKPTQCGCFGIGEVKNRDHPGVLVDWNNQALAANWVEVCKCYIHLFVGIIGCHLKDIKSSRIDNELAGIIAFNEMTGGS